MTLAAILSIFILMVIFMAACAVGELKSIELLEFISIDHFNLVAFYTIHIYMLSHQFEFGVGMIEFGCRFEGIRIMTIQTIR
jgi:hypothetical protein